MQRYGQLADAFDELMHASHTNPELLPDVQFMECRRAFFAGAWAVLQSLRAEEISYERMLLERELVEECDQFKRDVLAGKA